MKNKQITKTGILIENEKSSWLDNIILPENYTPKPSEEYMSDRHLKYFYTKLVDWKNLLISESDNTLDDLKNKHLQEPDANDRASSESETGIELRTRERYLKLISKIDGAMEKIYNKTYGYCDESGEEIGLKRLDARAIATLTIEAQEEHERRKKLLKQHAKEENF
jgi:DnaK suppressor protein